MGSAHAPTLTILRKWYPLTDPQPDSINRIPFVLLWMCFISFQMWNSIIYKCLYSFTCMYERTQKYTRTRTRTQTDTQTHAHGYIWMHVYLHKRIYIKTHIYMWWNCRRNGKEKYSGNVWLLRGWKELTSGTGNSSKTDRRQTGRSINRWSNGFLLRSVVFGSPFYTNIYKEQMKLLLCFFFNKNLFIISLYKKEVN